MRSLCNSLAMLLTIGILGTSALAMSNTDYQKARNASTLTSLDPHSAVSAQFAAHAGQTIELQGTVTGMFAGDRSSTFLLSVGQDTVLVSCAQQDPDIAVDNTLRVLAVVPAQGDILREVAATFIGMVTPAPASSYANTPSPITSYQVPEASISVKASADISHYAQAPSLTTHPKPASATKTATVTGWQNIVQIYADRIQTLNGNLDVNTARTIAYHLLAKSQANGIDPRLVFAVVTQESRFNPNAVSRCGAMGLGQLMPGTAAALGVQHPYDIAENLDGSVRYLACQLQRFGNITLALAAYNAGPNRVQNCGYQIPNISETQNYVSVIWRRYAQLAGFDPNTGPVYSN